MTPEQEKLLREDERKFIRCYEEDFSPIAANITMLAERLIDERQKNANTPSVEHCREERAEGNGGCGACALCCKEQRERAEKAEAELAEARKALTAIEHIYRNHNDGRECLCPYCLALKTYHIDRAAMQSNSPMPRQEGSPRSIGSEAERERDSE